MDIYQLFFSIKRHNSFFLQTKRNMNIKTLIPIVMGTVVGHLGYNLGAQGQKLALSFSLSLLFSCPRPISSLTWNPCSQISTSSLQNEFFGINLFLYIATLHLGPTARSSVHCDRDLLCFSRERISLWPPPPTSIRCFLPAFRLHLVPALQGKG